MSIVMKCLISVMLLVIAVQAQDVLSRVSVSPPAPLLPQTPPPSQVTPPPSPPPNCDETCSPQCAKMRIFRRLLCYVACMGKCIILPLDHANNSSNVRNPNEKNIDGVVNACYNNCT